MSQETTQDLTQPQSEIENALQDLQEDPEDNIECIATLGFEGLGDDGKQG